MVFKSYSQLPQLKDAYCSRYHLVQKVPGGTEALFKNYTKRYILILLGTPSRDDRSHPVPLTLNLYAKSAAIRKLFLESATYKSGLNS